ncbi:hypothetical protein [Tetragenococcus halophilus]|uniref:hypothetical protein n=1 Tax=Tetragenococcus halophilus TaxID=51669 RepID=UPI00300FDE5F
MKANEYKIMDLSDVSNAPIRVVKGDDEEGEHGYFIIFDDSPYMFFDNYETANNFAKRLMEALDIGYANGMLLAMTEPEKAKNELSKRKVDIEFGF